MSQPYRSHPPVRGDVPLGLTECPHCFSEVLAETDGSCPSCRRDVTEPPEAGLPRTKLRVDENTRMPDMCCTCGAATEESERVTPERDGEFPLWVRVLAAVLFVIVVTATLGLFFVARSFFTRPERRFELWLRRCRECQKHSSLIPEHTNLSEGTMTFVVVREFADKVREIREQRLKAGRRRR